MYCQRAFQSIRASCCAKEHKAMHAYRYFRTTNVILSTQKLRKAKLYTTLFTWKERCPQQSICNGSF
uniref:Uncharacterized protein n=1 Tax=Arundo donax TaxID=35708 RepID=A0A0A9CH29_ARUDO